MNEIFVYFIVPVGMWIGGFATACCLMILGHISIVRPRRKT